LKGAIYGPRGGLLKQGKKQGSQRETTDQTHGGKFNGIFCLLSEGFEEKLRVYYRGGCRQSFPLFFCLDSYIREVIKRRTVSRVLPQS